MKVLFLTNIPSPYRVDFFNELGELCDLTVLYERHKAGNRDEKWRASEAENFKEIYLDGKKFGDESSISFSVLKYLKDRTFDIIVIGGYSTPTGMLAISYLKLKKIPFTLNVDGGMIKKDNFIKKIIKTSFISSASAWLSTSEKTTDYLVYYGADRKRIYKYPFTSVKRDDIEYYIIDSDEKERLKQKLNIDGQKIVISVGSFIYRKGYDVLLNACKDLDRNIVIYIIGGIPTKEYIDLKEKLKLTNVHFINFKTKDELKEYYKVADLFVLPTREDIWGLVINEAMSYGLPIITTDRCVAGLELVENLHTGYIVPVEDHEALSNKINYILKNEMLRHDMSFNCLDIIKKFTIENMAKRHKEIFSEILGGEK